MRDDSESPPSVKGGRIPFLLAVYSSVSGEPPHRATIMRKIARGLLRTLGYLAVVVFPMPLAWGLDDVRGSLRDPARASYMTLAVGWSFPLQP